MRAMRVTGDIMLQMPGPDSFKDVIGPMHRAKLECHSGPTDIIKMQMTRTAVVEGRWGRLRDNTALPTGAEGRRALIL